MKIIIVDKKYLIFVLHTWWLKTVLRLKSFPNNFFEEAFKSKQNVSQNTELGRYPRSIDSYLESFYDGENLFYDQLYVSWPTAGLLKNGPRSTTGLSTFHVIHVRLSEHELIEQAFYLILLSS